MTGDTHPRGVAVLYNVTEDLARGEPRDLLADRGVIGCALAVAGALKEAGYRVAEVPLYDDLAVTLAPYPPTRWDVFNLVEGLGGRLFEEARIAWTLNAMGYRFTGAGGEAIARSTDKAQAKQLLAAGGVRTPRWWLFRHPGEVAAQVASLSFPVIVKPVAEDASIGVGPEAVVSSVAALVERVAYVVERYRQAALAEVFVAGREFNVAMWGDGQPEVLPLAEIDFSAFEDPLERIVSFAAKWEEGSFEYHHTPARCPAAVDGALGTGLNDTARRAWAAIGCRGYARVDVRVDGAGVPYVIEVNCNPDISPEAGFYNAARAAGYSYAGLAAHILEIARRERPYVTHRISFAGGRAVGPTDHDGSRRVHADRVGLRSGAVERIPG